MRRVVISHRSPLRLLIYGKPGSGKTTLAGTAGLDQRTAPVLWIDAGGNPISLARFTKAEIDVMRIERLSELADLYNWLATGQEAREAYAKLNNLRPPYKTLVFDGITHIQRLSFDAVQGTQDIAPGVSTPKPNWAHYRQVLGDMIRLASKFYTLPLHVIVTALNHPDQRQLIPGDDQSNFIYNEPLLAGQSVDELPGWALNVGRIALAATYDPKITRELKAEDHQPIIQFKPTRFVDAKDQHGLGDYVANPTIRKFLDTIEANAARADELKTGRKEGGISD